ncbi:hypothetical protein V1478_013722 [Vespula squamosa]|uniref:Uncharacterized protein n=1 Tax=Vespula squamosa TaxID=30214 RepID=A0ABD2A6Q7_VESSQ
MSQLSNCRKICRLFHRHTVLWDTSTRCDNKIFFRTRVCLSNNQNTFSIEYTEGIYVLAVPKS